MMGLHFSPLTQRRWQRFKSIRRGYVSFILLLVLTILSCFAELFANNRPLIVHFEGHTYFPTYGEMIPGRVFGLEYDYETDYRELARRFAQENTSDPAAEVSQGEIEKLSGASSGRNWLLMPVIPYNPFENDFALSAPGAPDWDTRHFLGTDGAGRDVASRLLYGYRIGIFFAIGLAFFEYIFGVGLGLLMGYFGGRIDLFGQRLVEIWSNIPTLYIVIIVASFIVPGFWSLLGILLLFGWMSKTQYMRALTLKEKNAEYVLAAQTVGYGTSSILLRQILPNTIGVVVTLLPFTIEASFTALTVYDYLGFGLPPPTPSWGELLRQGTTNLQNAPWLTYSVVTALVFLLVAITFTGEALREAFDPRKFCTYE